MLTAHSPFELDAAAQGRAAAELHLLSRAVGADEREAHFVVPEIHCAGCIARIERALKQLPDVTEARVNFTTKRVRLRWRAPASPPVIETLQRLGFSAHLHDAPPAADDATRGELVRALAVAGFAAMNIMLLSVSIWAGAEAPVRALFHWISAAIALPAILYSGRVFFRSAWASLRHGRTNMDVPIAVGVITAFGLSLYETITHGPHAYFDATVTLLFFLLIGRTLDHLMRERARTAVEGLLRLEARSATHVAPDGAHAPIAVDDIAPGMTLMIAPGERIPVNAEIVSGNSDVDLSLVTGESTPEPAQPGGVLWAGALNLSAVLLVRATATARASFLADMAHMMEAAESGRSQYRRIADRAARIYAPVVHLAAFLTLIAWWAASGDPHKAITIAIAVLIITCPCALGLAVPMVHVAAARWLFAQGVMLKDGGALERLAETDSVVFDKTGTLTLAAPQASMVAGADPSALLCAAALGARSLHPYARAIARLTEGAPMAFECVREEPGAGIEGMLEGACYRLGRPAWTQMSADAPADEDAVLLTRDGEICARFVITHTLRPGAAEAVAALKAAGFQIEIVSGDHARPVTALASALGVPHAARITPAGKVAHIARRTEEGRKVLMVGDGLNDAPALMAAHASIAPASAADVGRNAADFVFLRPSLMAVPEAVLTARRAATLVRQNMALAVLYNLIAVPIAIAGQVTPLIAAIAMSGSSVIVVANAMRIGRSASP